MFNRSRNLSRLLGSLAASLVLCASLAIAQPKPKAPNPATSVAPVSDQDLAVTQDELIKLLRMSPTLTSVVAHDPSLLADQDYVSRNNPELAQFLSTHPEIARNPEFYLFTRLDPRNGRRDQALERAIWPDLGQPRDDYSPSRDLLHDLVPTVVFACILTALIWLIRQFVENRRWGRIFKLQSEVHGRLIEKFNSTQELATYMGTEAGKRFLEAAPIPIGFDSDQRMPNAVARVLTPLQIGIVLTLLGSGLLFLRNASREMDVPMLFLGTIVLMPGIGFIISAGITWVLAGRLGLMPDHSAVSNRPAPPFDSQDRQ